MTTSTWPIERLTKVVAGVSYYAWRWYVYVASAFPLSHHCQAVLALGSNPENYSRSIPPQRRERGKLTVASREGAGWHNYGRWPLKKIKFYMKLPI